MDAAVDVVRNDVLFHEHRFAFDYVYGQQSKQEDVYNHSARPAVEFTLMGYNATIFAYGQTGTGKGSHIRQNDLKLLTCLQTKSRDLCPAFPFRTPRGGLIVEMLS